MTAKSKDDPGFSSTRAFATGHDHEHGHGDNIGAAWAEDPLAGLRGAMAWQYAWTSAIALAWSSEHMKSKLIADPREFFKVYANYTLPSGITLTVKEMEEADRAGNTTGWDQKSRIWYLQKTELTMYIPPPPQHEEQAVALAAYGATARAYPFTLC